MTADRLASRPPLAPTGVDAGSNAGKADDASTAMRPELTSWQLAELLRAGADWLWATDCDGRVSLLTEGLTAILGTPPRGFIGRHFTELFAHGSEATDLPSLLAHLEQRRPFRDLQVPLRACANDRLPQRLCGVPVFHPATGAFTGFQGLAVDLGAAARLRQRLQTYRQALDASVAALQSRNAELEDALRRARAADQAKARFLGEMGHQLRTPLNGIIAYAEAVETGAVPAGADRYASVIQDMGQAGRHLLELVTRVLDLAALEAGTVTVAREPVSLREAVAEAFAHTADEAAARGLDTSAVTLSRDHRVRADRQRLVRVLVELLQNAIRHSPEGTAIGLATRKRPAAPSDGEPDPGVELLVWDSGPGVDPALRERLFEPFAPIEIRDPGTANGGGLGLGLALAHRLLREMGGDLRIEDDAEGHARFVVQLLSWDSQETIPPFSGQ